jgi:AAA15 family ATPase/GTPase
MFPVRAELDKRDRDLTHYSREDANAFTLTFGTDFPIRKGNPKSVAKGYLLDQFRLLVILSVNSLSELESLNFAADPLTEETMAGFLSTNNRHLRFRGILDRQRNVLVSLSETGTGFSQLLPILFAAFSGDGELVAIQQPELHLHPALQSELGDLFIARALGERSDETEWRGSNQFVLETHSEHILLRIMRRIRETSRGTLPKQVPPVYPDDVSILYIDNSGIIL